MIPGNVQKHDSTNSSLLQGKTLLVHFSVSMLIDCLLKLFEWKISGSCAFRVAQNITMSVSGASNFEFQISKLFDIFKRISKKFVGIPRS